MMGKFVRLNDQSVVMEIIRAAALPPFHPEVERQFVEVITLLAVEERDHYDRITKKVTKPPPPIPPEPGPPSMQDKLRMAVMDLLEDGKQATKDKHKPGLEQ